ncbi:prolyl oligopeptidase family serine peptidase [Lentzea sp. NBC_00516]|uniref:alpha/beta hydrolase family protein n=1 Tax=Lentzea sp. NBC_00516 TaxID=2903582 RepID=UPI002E81BA27|nr:prolyl oligopeptidase family serine peptidase [Lentzea sp. NBC_00516]WUD28221.1 prolyl oligopeptidase family serine peptidase [Lentzea sp. NBC_00516]
MRELTDEIAAGHSPPPAKDVPTGVSIPGRHVAEVARHPDGRLAVITWSSPKIDPGLLNPALHVVETNGTVTDLGATPADAGSPVWWGDEVCYLALTPPHLQGGNAVFDQRHRNLTEGMRACPIDLVQDDGDAPIMVVATGLDTEFRRLDGAFLARVTGSHLPPRYRDLDGIPWGVQERLHHPARDGLELDGLLILPVGRTRRDGPFPLVTIVHGGPYDRWTDDLQLHWVPSAQWFAHQGIATFLPNPRGGQGHGHEFAAAVAKKVGQEEWYDIETGIDLLVAQKIADPDRLGIAGWSHGGFMAAWATTRTDRFKAALVGAGISDWPKLIATGEWGAFEAALGDSAEHSPLTYADRIRTEMLIVHGAEDTNVPVEQAELLHRAVKHSELVVYPGEGHSLRQREHRLDLLNRTRRLFAKL